MMETIMITCALFFAACIVGYGLALAIYYLIVGKILLGRFFEDSLYYIQEYGRGHDLDVNEEALTNNLKSRRTAVCVVSMVVATLIALAIGLSYRFMGSIPYAVAAMVGTALGFTTFTSRHISWKANPCALLGSWRSYKRRVRWRFSCAIRKKGSSDTAWISRRTSNCLEIWW